MLSKEFVIQLIKQKGNFVLTNGSKTNTFYDCSQLLKSPYLVDEVVTELVKKIPKNFDVVVSPALGATIFGYEVAKKMGKHFLFVEKVNGQMVMKRSFKVTQKRYIIIEDVITTGGTVDQTKKIIEDQGGEVVGVGCVVDRSQLKDIVSFMKVDISHE